MARMARAVAVGIPHHVTQRGNRRQQTFFCEDDYQTYILLVAEWCSRYGVEIWGIGGHITFFMEFGRFRRGFEFCELRPVFFSIRAKGS